MTWDLFFLGCFAFGFALILIAFLGGSAHLHLHFHGVHVGHGGARGGAKGATGKLNFGTIAAFLTWASDPHMEQRKQMGLAVMVYLLVFAGLLYASYRRVWRNVAH